MQTLSDIKRRLLVNLQNYPEIALRYQNGDPLVTAMIQAAAGMVADQSVDIDTAIIEPFIKSNVRTILADATNKGILPVATPCQYYIDIENKGPISLTISAGRYIDDVQGRTWRLLQTANIGAGETVQVQVEQSQIRTLDYHAIFTETFFKVELDIQEDLYLCAIRIYDQLGNNYVYRSRWLNSSAGEYAFNLKTDSMRKITAEFGDSDRCGTTIEANTILSFEITETDGEIDTSQLREASLQELSTAAEAKIQIVFADGGLIRAGTDPHSIEELRLLSSYPTHDQNAVFLGDFDFSVRKAFMKRCNYLTVWNETIHERYYMATLDDINHLHVAFAPKTATEADQLSTDIAQYIGELDTLYQGRVHQHEVEVRHFGLTVNAKLAPVHNVETVKAQILTLLLSRYGKDSLATTYFLADGFNTQEIANAIKNNIPAFQDHISDFNLMAEDISNSPIKPHQWAFMDESSIVINIQRTATTGTTLWTG